MDLAIRLSGMKRHSGGNVAALAAAWADVAVSSYFRSGAP